MKLGIHERSHETFRINQQSKELIKHELSRLKGARGRGTKVTPHGTTVGETEQKKREGNYRVHGLPNSNRYLLNSLPISCYHATLKYSIL